MMDAMEVLEPNKLVAGVPRLLIGIAGRSEVVCALESLRIVRARVDAAEVSLAQRLQAVSPLPEKDVARAARRSDSHGSRVRARAESSRAVPSLGAAIESGELSGEHVDAFEKALKGLPAETAASLKESGGELVAKAIKSGATPDEFARDIAREASRLEADDGEARLDRQRRDTRLRTWTDKQTGMWKLAGQFDPLSGVVLHGRFQAALAAMFANGIPAIAPTDPGERQDFLRALAFIALTAGAANATHGPGPASAPPPSSGGSESSESVQGPDNAALAAGPTSDLDWAPFAQGGPPRFGRPEIVVIIDTTSLDENGRPTIDWGLPIDLPIGMLRNVAARATITRVVLEDGSIVEAPGELNLGRTTRLANRAQRRALRCLYSTCSIPGCSVPFEYTKLHHVRWWRNGGRTDIANLLPLCSRHHTAVHMNAWNLELGPNRDLTISLPGGKVMKTGPPKRSAVS